MPRIPGCYDCWWRMCVGPNKVEKCDCPENRSGFTPSGVAILIDTNEKLNSDGECPWFKDAHDV